MKDRRLPAITGQCEDRKGERFVTDILNRPDETAKRTNERVEFAREGFLARPFLLSKGARKREEEEG